MSAHTIKTNTNIGKAIGNNVVIIIIISVITASVSAGRQKPQLTMQKPTSRLSAKALDLFTSGLNQNFENNETDCQPATVIISPIGTSPNLAAVAEALLTLRGLNTLVSTPASFGVTA